MTPSLHLIAWIACVVYSTVPSFWLLIHPSARYWRTRTRSPYRILLPLWLTMWAVTAGVTWRWRGDELYSTNVSWAPAALFLCAGFWLYRRAGMQFSLKQLSGVPEVLARHDGQRLVTTGIHARIRHPVYLGHLCEMLAWSVGSGLLVCYLLTAWALVTGAVMIRLEDAELEQRFGDEYRAYRRATPALLPRLHK